VEENRIPCESLLFSIIIAIQHYLEEEAPNVITIFIDLY
jgi:hypothetical protein